MAFNPMLGDAERTLTATAEQQSLAASLSYGPPFPAGYENLGEIGRGGMGIVYRARDLSLDREIAIKLMHEGYAPDSVSARRFLEEARIMGQLQHPGIPAIHQVGFLSPGRPYLAMKLVRGQTLDTLVAENRSLNFLAIFEAIAQAMAYAHSRGVIHRDLKPTNIMVGAFAEVQIMDWGLAKILEASSISHPILDIGVTGEHRIVTQNTTDSQTQQGEFMGTPAYMPPEQAIGATDKIDERSDVFGMGGILCFILTSKPPYSAGNAESTRQMAAQGRTEEIYTRLDDCKAEPGLIELAKRCLAANPDDRPANAGEVATAIAKLRTDAEQRARDAEMDQVATNARRRVMSRATVLVFGALLIGVGVSLEQAVRARQAEFATGEQLLLTRDAERIARAETAKAQEAEQAARQSQAEALLLAKKAHDAEILAKEKEQAAKKAELEARRAEQLAHESEEKAKTSARLAQQAAEVAQQAEERQREQARREMLAKEEALRLKTEAEVQERSSQAVLSFLQDLLAPSSLENNERSLPPNPKMTLKESLDRVSNDMVGLLQGQPLVEAGIRNTIGLAYLELGSLERAYQNFQQSLRIFERLNLADRAVALSVKNNLGTLYRLEGRYDQAERYYRQSLDGRVNLLGPEHPDTLRSMFYLASLCSAQRRFDEAEMLYRQAYEGRLKVFGPDHIETLRLANNLGYVYIQMGDYRQAESLLKIAVKGKYKLLDPEDLSLLTSVNNLAIAQAALGQYDLAEDQLRFIIAKRTKKLGATHFYTLLSINSLAESYRLRGELKKAEAEYQKVYQARQAGTAIDGLTTLISVVGLAKIAEQLQNFKQAETYWRLALQGYQKIEIDPIQEAESRLRLGQNLMAQRRHAEAAENLLEGYRQIVKHQAELPRRNRDATLRNALNQLIEYYRRISEPAEVEKWQKVLANLHPLAPPPREVQNP